MNMTITENDKKLLGFLAAFLVAVLFFFLVFRPLSEKQGQIEAELKSARAQEAELGTKADLAEEMTRKEEITKEQMKQVLARFYPVLQSQEAEKMITTLMLNHQLAVQSLTVTLPERSAKLDWYQYSENAAAYGQPADGEEVQPAISLYAARVTCVAEGSKENLWALIDDISEGYPAISIVSTEWSSTERVVAGHGGLPENGEAPEDGEQPDGSGAAEEIQQAVPVTVKTDRLTIGLEIYMCSQ